MMNNNFISEVLEVSLERADELFLVSDVSGDYYYKDLDALTAKYANLLAATGVEPGDRVDAQLDKSPEGFFLYFAFLRMGAIFLLLNSAYTSKEMEYFLYDA